MIQESLDTARDKENECCPKFDPTPWQEKEVTFKDKLCLMTHVKSFLHMPLNFGPVMKKAMDAVFANSAQPKQSFMMTDEKSLWGSDVYIEVSKDVPGFEMTKISGNYLTKVFEGEFKNIGLWIKEMQEFVKSRGKEMKKIYFYYTTCPACAKKFGKNYVVILAEI